jgi:hypothetical protein
VFAFILAITEVNMYLAYKYFIWKTRTTISFLRFCRKLATKALIYNEYMSLDDEEDDVTPSKSKRQRRKQDHI